MLRKPCSRSARASRSTSSRESVTRKIELSREKPQYLQLLMHSLERYSGANRRITLPNLCCVTCWERALSGSRNSPAAGEIKCAKSFNESFDFPTLARTEKADAPSDRLTKASSGSV